MNKQIVSRLRKKKKKKKRLTVRCRARWCPSAVWWPRTAPDGPPAKPWRWRRRWSPVSWCCLDVLPAALEASALLRHYQTDAPGLQTNHTHIHIIFSLRRAPPPPHMFIVHCTLTQVSLKVWIDIHVFAPLHHTLEDGHQTLQTLFTKAELLWMFKNTRSHV